ncbi:MAG: MarR family transcriptional regulator [Burkholderiaceae bacterium]|jgi:DNA-binding MarR family transcriptional regulator|nr:MarR family transcriptional regulator [Burkholderiaceae bacterium]
MQFPSQFKNDADASIGLVFIKAYNTWHTKIKRELRRLDITHPQFVLMTTIAYLSQHDAHISQARAAALANMDEMSVSQIVKTLLKSGHILRQDNPNDTRSYALSLTAKGSEAVKTALPVVEAIDKAFFEPLGVQKPVFLELLRQLADANPAKPGPA